MAFGPEPLGLAYFAAVKFAGYSFAGSFLKKRLSSPTPRVPVFGVARTILGLAAGIGFGALMLALGVDKHEWLFYAGLIPVRFAEWVATLWFFFGSNENLSGKALVKYSILGMLWSYVLDLPAIFALFSLPGGAWIC
jgi:hypothetical protein